MSSIVRRPFGRTGHASSAAIFGAAALGGVNQDAADRALELLLEHGINHIDTASRYGEAELRIGPWMAEHRDTFFLATKTAERAYADSRDEIHRSLDRLRVDCVDLLQIHSLSHPGEWEQVMGEDGALRAVMEARDEGLTRFIGVTGHGWTIAAMHLRSLARFDFDAVLMPWNWVMAANDRYRADFEAVMRACRARDVAVQSIKSIARGPWATNAPNRDTWYQPLEEQADIDRAVHFVLGRGDVFLNTAGDLALLPRVLDAAARYVDAPAHDDMADMAARRRLTPLFGIGS